MGDQDFILKSGAKLHVTPSDFKTAMGLVKAIQKATLGLPRESDASLAVVVSDEVEAAVHRCMARATYEGQRLDLGLFDDPTLGPRARQDYFDICARIIEVNCNPFFGKAPSTLKGPSATAA